MEKVREQYFRTLEAIFFYKKNAKQKGVADCSRVALQAQPGPGRPPSITSFNFFKIFFLFFLKFKFSFNFF